MLNNDFMLLAERIEEEMAAVRANRASRSADPSSVLSSTDEHKRKLGFKISKSVLEEETSSLGLQSNSQKAQDFLLKQRLSVVLEENFY